jgi:NAD(P)-dependent dehydrogenase (short-subunit alcohol dehydrogenase family)
MVGTAIVTGASQGIGRAIACRLSQDGFKVAINDLPSRKDQLEELHAYITQQGGTSIIILGDISVESEVKGMVDIVVERMGGIDVVSFLSNIFSSFPPDSYS